MYLMACAGACLCIHIQAALEAEEEALRLKHNEFHLKAAAARQECEHTVSQPRAHMRVLVRM